MLSKRTRSQLVFYAFAFMVIVLVHYLFGVRDYWVRGAIGLAVIAGGAFGTPVVARWYLNTGDRAKLTACAAVIVASSALVGAYVKDFVLVPTPQSPLYWLPVAFILFFPTALLYMALAEARRVLKRKNEALPGS